MSCHVVTVLAPFSNICYSLICWTQKGAQCSTSWRRPVAPMIAEEALEEVFGHKYHGRDEVGIGLGPGGLCVSSGVWGYNSPVVARYGYNFFGARIAHSAQCAILPGHPEALIDGDYVAQKL